MTTNDQPGDGWTLVLRRQPAWIVDGAPEGGYAADFELICCDCGDDPDLDYCEIRPRLQLVRGPYTIAAGSQPMSSTAGCTSNSGRHAGPRP
jgi:hypothetical protein